MTSTSGGQTASTAVDPPTSAETTAAGTLDGTGTMGTGSSGGTMSMTEPPMESSSDGGSGSSGGSSSSDGGPDQPGVGEPYGACDRAGACLDDNLCYVYQTFDMCLAPCGPGPEFACPEEPGGTAFPECIGAIGVYCMLNCAGGLECPEGTSCQEVFPDIFRCLWP